MTTTLAEQVLNHLQARNAQSLPPITLLQLAEQLKANENSLRQLVSLKLRSLDAEWRHVYRAQADRNVVYEWRPEARSEPYAPMNKGARHHEIARIPTGLRGFEQLGFDFEGHPLLRSDDGALWVLHKVAS